MKMKRLVLLGMLLVLAAVPSIASAAPNKGDPITFRFREGEFCGAGPCTPARALLEGTIKQTLRSDGRVRLELSHLSGTIRIGVSPFAKTTRHINVKSPGPVRWGEFGPHPLYETCLEKPILEEFEGAGGERYAYYWSAGWSANTVVGLSAGSSKGSAELGWWEQDFCRWQEQEGEEGFVKVTGDGSGSRLNGQLVGKLAGSLNLGGSFPDYVPLDPL